MEGVPVRWHGRMVIYGSLVLLLKILPATTGLSDAPSYPYENPQPPPCPPGDPICQTPRENHGDDLQLGDSYEDILGSESLDVQGDTKNGIDDEEDKGWNKDKDEENTGGRQESQKEEVEVILDCVFSTIPLVGGKWLTKIFRERVSDATLIEATNSFIDGGELLINLINLKPRAVPVKFFKSLSSCFDFEEDYNPYEREERERPTQSTGDPKMDEGPKVKMASSTLSHQRKRRSTKGGYGKDTLYGFALLGLLIVGSMIAYLIYLLTM
ncbi:uncharacterized protein LOC125026681 [Penaeus chinensis]|uniref:uncharacterized protein LOC125026681 n=1 Tax=Penaeus chinensis TaxID=139456 RepID=UPI001FB5A469|nr:uncharacterized protein LOC125026681 [Penaeus chinensis]